LYVNDVAELAGIAERVGRLGRTALPVLRRGFFSLLVAAFSYVGEGQMAIRKPTRAPLSKSTSHEMVAIRKIVEVALWSCEQPARHSDTSCRDPREMNTAFLSSVWADGK